MNFLEIFYLSSMFLMIIAATAMIVVLFGHLELKENRMLFLMVIGLLVDICGSFSMCHSSSVEACMMAYRVTLIGRGVFAVGVIKYIARMFNAKHPNIVLAIWGSLHFAGFACTYFYKVSNIYLDTVSIGKFNHITLLIGDRHILYYLVDTGVYFIGFWALYLIIKEYFRIRKKGDNVQLVVTFFYAFAIFIQGLTFFVYELNYESYPNYTPLFRGAVAVVYSIIAVKYHFTSYDSLARKTLMNDMGAGFIVLTNKFRILFYNDVASEVFTELKDLVGSAPYSPEVEKAVRNREFEVEKNGKTYRVTADRIFSGKRLEGYTMLIINISDVIQLEAQATISMEAKNNVLSSMAHELRTPLNALNGAAEMMLKAVSDRDYDEYLRVIKTSVATLNENYNSIIHAFDDDMAADSAIDTPYDMSILLSNVVDSLNDRITRNSIDFDVNISPTINVTAIGDVGSVRKILVNVLGNAVRYTKNGIVRFYVFGRRRVDGMYEYIFNISDTGGSIPFLADDTDNSTEGDFGSSDYYQNEGIGLALAKRKIAELGGTFSTKSEAANETSFIITIPQKIGENITYLDYGYRNRFVFFFLGDKERRWEKMFRACAEQGIEYHYVPNLSKLPEKRAEDGKRHIVVSDYDRFVRKFMGSEKLEKYYCIGIASEPDKVTNYSNLYVYNNNLSLLTIQKICSSFKVEDEDVVKPAIHKLSTVDVNALLVDDDYLNRIIGNGILNELNVNVETASGGYECLEVLARGRHYDIIFMDYMMEDMDGIETTKRIRKIPLYNNIPIIAFTANDVLGARDKYIAAGMNDCLIKPAGTEGFSVMLEKYLPREKVVYTEVIEDESASIEYPFIEDVNVSGAMKYVSGNLDAYKEMLGNFSREIPIKLETMESLYEKHDYKNLSIITHGLKSASRMLGMENLSDLMALMEKASGDCDEGYVEDNIRGLLDYYGSFKAKLSEYEGVRANREKIDISGAKLYNLLASLRIALEDFEMTSAEEIMDEISEGTYEGDEAEYYKNLSDSISEVDYYASLSCVNEWIKKFD